MQMHDSVEYVYHCRQRNGACTPFGHCKVIDLYVIPLRRRSTFSDFLSFLCIEVGRKLAFTY